MSDDLRGDRIPLSSVLPPIDWAALWAFGCGLWAGAPSSADFPLFGVEKVVLILALWLAADLAPRVVRRLGEAFGRWTLAPQVTELLSPILPYAQPRAPIARWRAAWLGLEADRAVALRALVGGLVLGLAALWLGASLGRTPLAALALLLLAQGATGFLAERRPRLARALGAGALTWGAWLLGSLALGGWSWPLWGVGAWAGLGMAAATMENGRWLGRLASALIVVALLALQQPLVAAFALAQTLAAEAWRHAPERRMSWLVFAWEGVVALAALAAQPALAVMATWGH